MKILQWTLVDVAQKLRTVQRVDILRIAKPSSEWMGNINVNLRKLLFKTLDNKKKAFSCRKRCSLPFSPGVVGWTHIFIQSWLCLPHPFQHSKMGPVVMDEYMKSDSAWFIHQQMYRWMIVPTTSTQHTPTFILGSDSRSGQVSRGCKVKPRTAQRVQGGKNLPFGEGGCSFTQGRAGGTKGRVKMGRTWPGLRQPTESTAEDGRQRHWEEWRHSGWTNNLKST